MDILSTGTTTTVGISRKSFLIFFTESKNLKFFISIGSCTGRWFAHIQVLHKLHPAVIGFYLQNGYRSLRL